MDYIPYDYKKAEKIAERTRAFYDAPAGRALIHIKSCDSLDIPPMPPLNSFSFPDDTERYLDMRAEREYAFPRFHEGIDDDYIPSVSPWYGIAEHTAFLGGKVDFTPDTTFQHQICENIEDCEKLTLDPENMWIKLVVGGIKYLREKWGEYIPVKMRGADGPSDIANAVRGTDIFYDIYDEPEALSRLMDFCAEAANFTLDLQRAEATEIAGGRITGFGLWMPGKCMGQLSEDFSTMVSPDVYEEFFLPALEKCVADCDMAMLHTHSLGQKLLPLFAKIDKIRLIELSSDPNSDRAVTVFRKYHEELKDKNVIVAPTYEELCGMGDLLESSKTIIWYYAKDEDDAKRALEAVEKYRFVSR